MMLLSIPIVLAYLTLARLCVSLAHLLILLIRDNGHLTSYILLIGACCYFLMTLEVRQCLNDIQPHAEYIRQVYD